jgi:hypothetical protein
MENKSCYYPSNIPGEVFKVTEVAFSLDGQDFRRSLGGGGGSYCGRVDCDLETEPFCFLDDATRTAHSVCINGLSEFQALTGVINRDGVLNCNTV